MPDICNARHPVVSRPAPLLASSPPAHCSCRLAVASSLHCTAHSPSPAPSRASALASPHPRTLAASVAHSPSPHLLCARAALVCRSGAPARCGRGAEPAAPPVPRGYSSDLHRHARRLLPSRISAHLLTSSASPVRARAALVCRHPWLLPSPLPPTDRPPPLLIGFRP